jgi:hypothetical protein
MNKRVALLIAVFMAVLVAAVPYLWSLGLFSKANPVNAAGALTDQPNPTPKTTRLPAAAPKATVPLVHAAPVSINTGAYFSWSVMNRNTGEVTSSPNANVTNVTASMIKAWLASDFLRRKAEKNQTPGSNDMHELTIMIRDSDNNAASYFYRLNGNGAGINRLISMCGLTDTKAVIDWAHTLMSSRDIVKMGDCIGDGTAAGPKWTDWVLNEMRSVRGAGKFGPIQVLPGDEATKVAIKNGWVIKSDGKWHINCMAVGDDWVLGVMTVYPSSKGMGAGIDICKSVTTQLMAKTS